MGQQRRRRAWRPERPARATPRPRPLRPRPPHPWLLFSRDDQRSAAPRQPIAAAWMRSSPRSGCAAPLGILPAESSSRAGGKRPDIASGPRRPPHAPRPLRLRVSAVDLPAGNRAVTAGHGVLSPVSARPLRQHIRPRHGFVQRTARAPRRSVSASRSSRPSQLGMDSFIAFDARRDSPLPRFVETRSLIISRHPSR